MAAIKAEEDMRALSVMGAAAGEMRMGKSGQRRTRSSLERAMRQASGAHRQPTDRATAIETARRFGFAVERVKVQSKRA